MERDLNRLAAEVFDVIVIGGGIYGASLAWEAASRGFSVALLEKKDFAGATSANSLKIIHGGFRYLQHADFQRLRSSSLERRALMRIAPHLVHPLPVLMPTYGHGIKGREALSAALALNALATFDRNQGMDMQKHIPAGRIVSRGEVLRYLPGLPPEGLTGGIIFYDAQVYNAERLVLAFLHSAAAAGAALANYAAVTGFVQAQGRLQGVQAQDTLTGEAFEVRGRLVINTAGPWAGFLPGLPPSQPARQPLAKAVNLVTRRLFDGPHAVGLMGQNNLRDRAALVDKGASFLFVAPWRGRSLVGTSYTPYQGSPDGLAITRHDVQYLLDALNRAYPGAQLSQEDVSFVHAGLLPASEIDAAAGSVQLERHHRVIDHAAGGLDGLLSVVSVKYTTARSVAAEVLQLAAARLGRPVLPSRTAETPLHGGQIEHFNDYLHDHAQRAPCGLGAVQTERLIYNYGSAYPQVLTCLDPSWQSTGISEEHAVLVAEALHAVRYEMAQKLADTVLRRSEAGSAGPPAPEALAAVASAMGRALGWSESRMAGEIEEVNEIYHIAG